MENYMVVASVAVVVVAAAFDVVLATAHVLGLARPHPRHGLLCRDDNNSWGEHGCCEYGCCEHGCHEHGCCDYMTMMTMKMTMKMTVGLHGWKHTMSDDPYPHDQ